MATYKEITYMCLDLLKERSDDAFFTEEHIIFLAKHMRALLLERKLKESRNSAFEESSDDNTQVLCLGLEPAQLLPSGCTGDWLKSIEKIPEFVKNSTPKVYPVSDLLHTTVSYIPAERMPYVGYNKWLKNIIYVSKSSDDYLYLHSNNPQFMYLENLKLEGVFEDPEEAAKLSCDAGGGSSACDPLEMTFPLEDALIPACIEMIVQELAGPRYAPDDSRNNARDDMSDMGYARQTSAMPVAATEDRRRQQPAKKQNEEASE